MPLSTSQKDIIKASIPFLEEHGVDLTAQFYQYMLDTHPEVRPFFNKSHQATKSQPRALAFALLHYAKNIDDLTPLLAFVRQIVEKHVGLQVKPEHYDIVGACLLHTLREILGEKTATAEFLEAWRVAYYDLANVLIDLEKKRYDEVIRTEHGWDGFKHATVTKIVQECEGVKSVYFELDDHRYAVPFPGQYVCLRLSTDGGKTIQSREYSLSNALSEEYTYYRISVKRIEGGVVSNYIHNILQVGDKVDISSPFGKLLEGNEIHNNDAIVMLIAGIGATPSLSLAEHFLRRGNKVKLFVSQRAGSYPSVFRTEFARLAEEYKNLELQQFITGASGPDNDTTHHRRIAASDLKFIGAETYANAHYFLIGPQSYAAQLTDLLASKGVPPTSIRSEQFGPVKV